MRSITLNRLKLVLGYIYFQVKTSKTDARQTQRIKQTVAHSKYLFALNIVHK